jgi:site-specific recombinase XerD
MNIRYSRFRVLWSLVKEWFFESNLAPYVDVFVDYLKQGHYAKNTIRSFIGGFTHFARWASQSNLNIKQLKETAVTRFLDDHLPYCDCPASACRSYRDLRAAYEHLLRILRNSGALAET